MKSFFTKAFFFLLGTGFLLMPFSAFAVDNVNPEMEFSNVLQQSGLIEEGTSLRGDFAESAIGQVINIILTYIGVATLILIIYAGGLWATAAGNETKIETAKKILTGSVIGLVIIFSAAVLVNFVLSRLADVLG